MIDNSAMYNLTNPALTEDICESYFGKMMPMPPASFGGGSYIPGVTGTMNGTRIQGSLKKDTYEKTRHEKDMSVIKKLLIGAAAIGAGILCFKGGKKVVAGIKNLFTKIKGKFSKTP